MIQGIVTGVGFLGAGVIVRSEKGHHVQGLTTAACVWVTACMGAAYAVAQLQVVLIGVVLVFVILVFGGPFEKAIDRRWPTQSADQPPEHARPERERAIAAGSSYVDLENDPSGREHIPNGHVSFRARR
jgi:putative Mg2+ transporter-C (MgtC) family protein